MRYWQLCTYTLSVSSAGVVGVLPGVNPALAVAFVVGGVRVGEDADDRLDLHQVDAAFIAEPVDLDGSAAHAPAVCLNQAGAGEPVETARQCVVVHVLTDLCDEPGV